MKRRIKHIPVFIAFILSIMGIWSCGKQPYFTQYSEIDCLGWSNTDTVSYDIPKMHDSLTKNLSISLRYNDNYDYRFLSLGVKIFDGKKVIHTDTVHYELFSESGKIKGEGAVYAELEKKVCPMALRKGHTYKIKVYHIMRLDPIKGIYNLSVRLED